MVRWLTSDTHWGHKLMAEKRGYASPEAMDRDLIERWNAVVSADDQVYHLGDVSFRGAPDTRQIATQLKGRVTLVTGNHDKGQQLGQLHAAGWRVLTPPGMQPGEKAYPILVLTELERPVVLCHYPITSWPGAHRGALMLHGHCHGNLHKGDERTTRTDVGVDGIWGPGPVALEAVVARLRTRRHRSVDHHASR